MGNDIQFYGPKHMLGYSVEILETLNKYAPLRNIKNKVNSVPWMTSSIKKTMKIEITTKNGRLIIIQITMQ